MARPVREVGLVVIRHEGVLDHLAHLHDGPSVGFGGIGTALVPGVDSAPPHLALERVRVAVAELCTTQLSPPTPSSFVTISSPLFR